MTYIKTSLVVLLSIHLISCGKETDADRIADAQACLDQASAANASECVSKVEGINTKGANLIRCVGTFMKQNLGTPSALASIFTALDSNGGGGSGGTIGIMNAISFKAGGGTAPNGSDLSDANYASSICNQSNSPGLGMLSTLTVTATSISQLAGDGTIDNGDLAACATGCSPEQKEAIGSAVQVAYEANCANGGSSLGDVCTQLDSVIQNSGSNQAVAEALLQCLGASPPAYCQGF